jgi:hypothetical protein
MSARFWYASLSLYRALVLSGKCDGAISSSLLLAQPLYGRTRRARNNPRWFVFCLESLGSNKDMTSTADISVLYREFTEALAEVLAENSVGPARRGRLARARAAVKKHPKYSEHEYFIAVETAFQKWEAIQNVGR